MSKGRNTTVVSARLPDELADWLNAGAARLNMSRSELINIAIGKFRSGPWAVDIATLEDRRSLKRKKAFLRNIAEPTVTPNNQSPPAGQPDPYSGTPRNAPCPCGSGKKYKRCHLRQV